MIHGLAVGAPNLWKAEVNNSYQQIVCKPPYYDIPGYNALVTSPPFISQNWEEPTNYNDSQNYVLLFTNRDAFIAVVQ